MTTNVDRPCSAYVEMEKDWCLIRDLKGGTRVMRERGEKWLPKEEGEEIAQYRNRLARSFLYPGYQKACDELIAKPFTQPVKVSDLPAPLDKIEDNADRQGADITQFARSQFQDALDFGKAHILVDMPAAKPSNLADEEAQDVRPYFVSVKADQVIGWKDEVRQGIRVLTEVRIKECVTVADGEYGEKTVKRVRVWGENAWRIEVENADAKGQAEYQIESSGVNPLGVVPLVTWYTNKNGFMTSKPALDGIAQMNLAHWQSASDQRNLLRFLRAPILYETGVTEEEGLKTISVGPGAHRAVQNAEADLKYVEHTGAGAGVGREDIVDLEEKMSALALQPLMNAPGAPTATGMALDKDRTDSLVKQWARALEHALEEAYSFAAKWQGATLPADFTVDVFDEFNLVLTSAADLTELRAMRKDKQISHATYLKEVIRRGLLPDSLDIEAEIQAVEDEAPDLSALAPFLGGTKPPVPGQTPKPEMAA